MPETLEDKVMEAVRDRNCKGYPNYQMDREDVEDKINAMTNVEFLSYISEFLSNP